jgi:hypothetical protein
MGSYQSFRQEFLSELTKHAAKVWGKDSYVDPDKHEKADREHWDKRRRRAILLGLIGARKGRRLRTAAGAIGGSLVGQLAGSLAASKAHPLNKLLASQVGSVVGQGAGAYLAHGKYDKNVARKAYKKLHGKD